MNIKVQIQKQEKEEAKYLAKTKGMTFQGWLGQLIKNELKKSREEQNGVNDTARDC